MRLPLSKVYRAFPELDRFSDEECEAYVRYVSRRSGWRIVAASWAAALCSMFGIPVLLAMAWPLFGGAPRVWGTAISVLATLGLFGGPVIGFVCRDTLLRRAIRVRIRAAACPECSYSLIGLKTAGGRVKCPECGQDVDLVKHDIAESDLIAERA